MPKNFTPNQNKLIDSITLSLEHLDSLLFFLEKHHEEQQAYSIDYPNLSLTYEPRALILLYMAGERQRAIRDNFEQLALGEK